jgi:hypothetical protein
MINTNKYGKSMVPVLKTVKNGNKNEVKVIILYLN